MDYLHLSIIELHKALLSGQVSPLDLAKEAIELAKTDTNNAFEYISEKEAFEAIKNLDNKDKNNVMWGIPFVIKDNFSTKDIPTTGSSKMLEGYKPVFSSEVYERLINAGGIPIGKTTLDELAMGGSGSTGHKGKTFNPYDPTHKHIIGGSSCGSAAAVAAGIVPLGIGSDTGDSVRKPASYSALVGFKPSWGRISRFGLFPFAPSLDHVAYFTRNVEDSAALLEILSGRDEKDSTSLDKPVEHYLNNLTADVHGIRIAAIKEILDLVPDNEIKKTYLNTLTALEKRGAVINYVSIDIRLCRVILPTYFIISSCEATSSNAYLDGIKFGPRVDGSSYEEVMMKTRTQGLSEGIRRRFIIGSYSLLSENQHDVFVRAQKCRRLIVNRVNEILKDNDVIYLPASPSTAPLFDSDSFNLVHDIQIADNYLAIGNFGGFPSLTLPLGNINGMPYGGNITGRVLDEQMVLNCSLAIQEITGLKDLIAEEKK